MPASTLGNKGSGFARRRELQKIRMFVRLWVYTVLGFRCEGAS